MKINHKQTLKIFLFSFFSLAFISPLISLAVTNTTATANQAPLTVKKEAFGKTPVNSNKEATQTKKVTNICQAITTQAEKVKNRFTNKTNQQNQKRNALKTKIEQARKTRLEKINQRRKNREIKLNEAWGKLEGKAQTDEQKVAVKKFEQSIQDAINIRNEAMDKLITDFRTAVKNKLLARKDEINNQIITYKDAVFSIIDQAVSDCNNGQGNAKEIRENYRQAIKSARLKFQTDRKTINTLKTDLASLKEEKKSEAQTIRETFKNSIETAKSELRASFSSTLKADTSSDTSSASGNK